MKKIKKTFWEELFGYPSFNIRFWFVLFVVAFGFGSLAYLVLYKYQFVSTISDQVAVLNLMVQTATLVLGVFAAYYALRQLVETRFTGLDEAGMRELKNKRYLRAIQKWKEAFYIRPEAGVFLNLGEAYLLIGDWSSFDAHIKTMQLGLLKNKMFEEESDRIILFYLKVIRQLLVKNQGEAEKSIKDLVALIKEFGDKVNFGWDFSDLTSSDPYKTLSGECKIMTDNIVAYIRKTMPKTRLTEFQNGNYASQAEDQS